MSDGGCKEAKSSRREADEEDVMASCLAMLEYTLDNERIIRANDWTRLRRMIFNGEKSSCSRLRGELLLNQWQRMHLYLQIGRAHV